MDSRAPATAGLVIGHSLLIYSSPEHRRKTLADWVRDGLSRGEKVVATGVDLAEADGLLGLLERDAEAALARHQLELVRTDELYRPDLVRQRLRSALDDGWPALRVAGTTEPALDSLGPDLYSSLEGLLDELSGDQPLSVLCHCAAEAPGLWQALDAHPLMSDQLGTVAVREDRRRRSIAVDVVGEFDCSNTHLLREALTDAVGRVGANDTLTIEIGGLRFLSVGAARTLLAATAPVRRRPGAVLVADADPAYVTRLRMLGVHEQAGFVIEAARVDEPSQA